MKCLQWLYNTWVYSSLYISHMKRFRIIVYCTCTVSHWLTAQFIPRQVYYSRWLVCYSWYCAVQPHRQIDSDWTRILRIKWAHMFMNSIFRTHRIVEHARTHCVEARAMEGKLSMEMHISTQIKLLRAAQPKQPVMAVPMGTWLRNETFSRRNTDQSIDSLISRCRKLLLGTYKLTGMYHGGFASGVRLYADLAQHYFLEDIQRRYGLDMEGIRYWMESR